MGRHTAQKRQMPAWLLGLILAAILFGIGILVFGALGFGDNPVVDTDASASWGLSVVGL